LVNLLQTYAKNSNLDGKKIDPKYLKEETLEICGFLKENYQEFSIEELSSKVIQVTRYRQHLAKIQNQLKHVETFFTKLIAEKTLERDK
jgi:uncharacterized coiled-coil protein SlyX